MERPVMRQGEDGKLEERLREYTLNEVERRECCQREADDRVKGFPVGGGLSKQILREVEEDIEFVRKEFEKGMSNSLEEGARSVEQGTRPVLYTRYCGLHDKEHSGKCPECR